MQFQISGVECLEAHYNSMQSVKYGQDAAMGVYYQFTFALFEIPLAWIYQFSCIGGIKVTSSPIKISCQQYAPPTVLTVHAMTTVNAVSTVSAVAKHVQIPQINLTDSKREINIL